MPTFTCEEGQVIQIGDITLTVLEVDEGEVVLRIEGADVSSSEFTTATFGLEGQTNIIPWLNCDRSRSNSQ